MIERAILRVTRAGAHQTPLSGVHDQQGGRDEEDVKVSLSCLSARNYADPGRRQIAAALGFFLDRVSLAGRSGFRARQNSISLHSGET